MTKYMGAAKSYPHTTLPNKKYLSRCTAHLYIVKFSTVQCTAAVEEESSRPFVEFEVPMKGLPHTDQLIPPIEIRYKGF